MATTPVSQSVNRGGAFLIASTSPEDVFTPADLSDDQRLIGRTAEEFVANEIVPHIPDLEKHKEGLMRQLVKKAGEIGLLGVGIPEEYGGAALDKISMAVLSEKISAYPSYMVAYGAHTGIGATPIVYFGTDAQKKKYLPKMATGELLSCYALSESQSGSDALAVRTRAVLSPDGESWILNGQKMWISSGGFSDLYVVFAKVDGEKFSAFIVERGTQGFSVGAEENKMGIHGSSTVPLFFENAAIPKENLLHDVGRGHVVAFNTLNAGRFSLGASCVGSAKTALALSSKYAKERIAFGKSISEFGLIKAKLGEMAIRTFALESMVYRTAGMIEASMSAAGSDRVKQVMQVLEEYAIESSIAKVVGSETLSYCVDEAVQIYGGYGFHEDYPVARMYRDSRINRIFEGTNEINRLVIIQMLTRRAMAGTLPLIPAAMKLRDELLAGPSFEEPPAGTLAEEERALAQAKKIFLLAAGAAVEKFRDQLANQQEIIGSLANIAMDVYAMESALRRTQKCSGRRPAAGAISAMGDAVRVFIYDAMDRIEKDARTALAATADGDILATQIAALRRLAKHAPVDTIALRRRVADAVLAQDRYPFEGR
ncbi:MAG TPA: acyl-CoA dehydrogenase family protein [Candidatus Polarisedimenticolia bacterium]|nr:acyl-CoA dehydrogenase family protein [Candidatus Polarisedimenticolia bacterium]